MGKRHWILLGAIVAVIIIAAVLWLFPKERWGTVFSLLLVFGGLVALLLRSLYAKEVERRIIFLFILVAVAAPILFPITFTEKPTAVVQAVFDKIENLPSGSTVLLSFDFDPAMAPEVQPMANAISRHCLEKGHKVIFMSLWATGQALLSQSLSDYILLGFPDKVDGVDYVNIGYKAGNEGVLNVIVSNFEKMFPTDVNSVPLKDIRIFDDIASAKDVDFIMSIGGGMPGPKEWVLFVGDPGDVDVGVGVAAVVAPQMYPYYPAQVIGILGGVKGAAEYEYALKDAYPVFADMDTPGLRMMGPQTLAHIVILSFIVIGNIIYFRGRRERKQ
ncbi:MAG: hypothetical protein JSW34_07600 [Candidatus Zixiibacteriota bacterium]|nr:MAG: hypothetical protein JSW34_07600 [candidate division Zixibacteria bacterium]